MTTTAPEVIEGIDLDAPIPCDGKVAGQSCPEPAAWRLHIRCPRCERQVRWLYDDKCLDWWRRRLSIHAACGYEDAPSAFITLLVRL